MKSMPLRHELRRKILYENRVKTRDMFYLEMPRLALSNCQSEGLSNPTSHQGMMLTSKGLRTLLIIKDVRKAGLVQISSYGPIGTCLIAFVDAVGFLGWWEIFLRQIAENSLKNLSTAD